MCSLENSLRVPVACQRTIKSTQLSYQDDTLRPLRQNKIYPIYHISMKSTKETHYYECTVVALIIAHTRIMAQIDLEPNFKIRDQNLQNKDLGDLGIIAHTAHTSDLAKAITARSIFRTSTVQLPGILILLQIK